MGNPMVGSKSSYERVKRGYATVSLCTGLGDLVFSEYSVKQYEQIVYLYQDSKLVIHMLYLVGII